MKWLIRLLERRAERRAREAQTIRVVGRSGVLRRERLPEVEAWK